MPEFAITREARHSAKQMFDLVADVERYPEFLPLCEKLALRGQAEEEGRDVLTCDMTVGYKAIRETFTTRVVCDRPAMGVDFEYLSGPFRRLAGEWRFEAKGARACLVHFHIDYEFRSLILGALMGTMFDRAFRKFANAFETRADKLYGVQRPASTRA